MFRTLDPATGRYLEADPIALAGGLNLYGYAANSPTNFIDPTGLFCVYQQLTGRMTCYPWSPVLPPECRKTCDQPGTPRDVEMLTENALGTTEPVCLPRSF
jgi:uncharacterized protein RhaS with RHS repeats